MIVLGGLGSQIRRRRNTLTLNLADTYNSGFRISRIYAAKNVPTQETPTCQGARIQKPDEDPGGPARDRATQDSRPSQVDCLIRLWDSQKFGGCASPPNSANTLSRGRRTGDRLLAIAAAPADSDESRFGFAVSSRVGGAVRRNTIKRRLREIARRLPTDGSWDLVISARPAARDASYSQLERSTQRMAIKLGVANGRDTR